MQLIFHQLSSRNQAFTVAILQSITSICILNVRTRVFLFYLEEIIPRTTQTAQTARRMAAQPYHTCPSKHQLGHCHFRIHSTRNTASHNVTPKKCNSGSCHKKWCHRAILNKAENKLIFVPLVISQHFRTHWIDQPHYHATIKDQE